MTERLHFHFSLLCTGEGNGNPLQCSCLENPGTGEPGGLPSMGSQSRTLSIDISNTFTFDPVILPVEIYPKNMPEQVQNDVYLRLVLVALL